MIKVGRLLGLDRGAAAPGRGRPAERRGGRKPGRILAAKLVKARGRTIPWHHAAIYAALVVAVGVALALWDHAYEARRAALLRPPPPEVLAKNLVEDIVGPGTVRHVSVDPKAGTLDLTVEDVLVKPGQSLAEKQKNLTTEGTLAIQLVQSRLRSLTTVTVHLVKAGTPLATVRIAPGQKAPTADFAPGLK